jgi:ankyrin repeat protein
VISVTSFLWTVECNVEKMRALLSETPSLLDAVGIDGETPMGAAAHNGQTEAIEYLLAKGLDLDLFAACTMGWTDQIRTFLQREPELVHAHAPHAHNYPVLHFAAVTGQVAAAEVLLEYGVDLNAHDGTGYTALHCAARYGQAEMISWLLSHGAEADAQITRFRVTPLHMAALRGPAESVSALIAAGADVNARTRDGETPLENALFKGHQEIAALLREAGAVA